MSGRPFILDPLFKSISTIDGIGTKTLNLVSKVTCGSAVINSLNHMPIGMVDRTNAPKLADAKAGEIATLRIRVNRHFPPDRRGRPWRVWCSDDTGTITLVFFRPHIDWIQSQLPQGSDVIVSGMVEAFDGKLQMTHPDEIGTPEDFDKIAIRTAKYPLTAGLSNRMMQKVETFALTQLPDLPEWSDKHLVKQRNWLSWKNAMKCIHNFDGDIESAKDRLSYDEFFAHQLTLSLIRSKNKSTSTGRKIPPSKQAQDAIIKAFGFALTGAQQKAIFEIGEDMGSERRMARLLHGDVGSGKTIVAAIAIARCAESGAQSALVAPTEILARQHEKTITPLMEAAGISCITLTGKDKGTERKQKLEQIKNGKAQVIIGTHAIFQEEVAYDDLAFSVIDEQHKFGVEQRLSLSSKAKSGSVDMLLMSATPIPRSLAMTVYGDMDISRLDEKPQGRQPIDTRVISLDKIDELLDGLERRVQSGAQIYWVCPLVEESHALDLMAAQDRFDILKEKFGARVGLVHGRMEAEEKDEVMQQFSNGNLDILVATTVIEVGVNVPKASVMVVEHSERFGMAQLHQLRGRVGRGSVKSYCILLYDGQISATARKRLDTLRQSDDGFYIAQEDLKLRGAGDILGLRQSGEQKFKIGDPVIQVDLLNIAHKDARYIIEKDPDLSSDRGHAIRTLLYLFERDRALKYLKAG